jgi:hypothetical protein
MNQYVVPTDEDGPIWRKSRAGASLSLQHKGRSGA